MNLSEYNFPEVTKLDMAFSTFDTPSELVIEANQRNIEKGRKKFNELFFSGGKLDFQDDVEGTWKEKAFLYARALMKSFTPKHENKEAVCAMIFEETLKL